MASPSFSFSHATDDLAEPLDAILTGVDPATIRQVTAILDMLRDRDHDVEDAFTSALSGQKDVTPITATAGGATITFLSNFARTPTVVVAMGDSAAGKTVNVVEASRSASSFKVQVFNGATEVTSGNYKVAWIAV